MAYYDVTAFDGTTIVGERVKQLSMIDTGAALSRIALLENGAKFDADGTADGDTVLGQVVARYQIIPAGTGMIDLHTAISALEALRGKHGTLTGKQYGPSSTTTRTCTARCIAADPVEIVETGMPLTGARYARAEFVIRWEKLTEWA